MKLRKMKVVMMMKVKVMRTLLTMKTAFLSQTIRNFSSVSSSRWWSSASRWSGEADRRCCFVCGFVRLLLLLLRLTCSSVGMVQQQEHSDEKCGSIFSFKDLLGPRGKF